MPRSSLGNLCRNHSIITEFWSYVHKTNDCWLWTGPTGNGGYGFLPARVGKRIRAHHYSWRLTNGVVKRRLHVGHECGNRLCVNPAHLFLGRPGHRTSRIDSEVERFWSQVLKTDDCWLWTGGRISAGYGNFWLRGKAQYVRAHRYSWELANGTIGPGLGVLHKCDNPPCVNPDHLFVGNQGKNGRDMALKRRVHTAKLTDDDVRLIRSLCNGHKTYGMTKFLAEKYGVSRESIRNAATGRTFKPLYDDDWDDEY